MNVRSWAVGALVGGMLIVGPGAAFANSANGGVGLGGILGGDGKGALLGNGCNDGELVSVAGGAGLIGIDCQRPIDSIECIFMTLQFRERKTAVDQRFETIAAQFKSFAEDFERFVVPAVARACSTSALAFAASLYGSPAAIAPPARARIAVERTRWICMMAPSRGEWLTFALERGVRQRVDLRLSLKAGKKIL